MREPPTPDGTTISKAMSRLSSDCSLEDSRGIRRETVGDCPR